MGMFGELKKLDRHQQTVSTQVQQPVSEKTPEIPAVPSPSTPAITTKSAKAITKKPKMQIASSELPSEAEPIPQAVSGSKKSSNAKTVRSFERTKIRHSFDVFQDQLFELRDLAYQRQRGSLKKVPLGDLVQEALDMYLAAQRQTK